MCELAEKAVLKTSPTALNQTVERREDFRHNRPSHSNLVRRGMGLLGATVLWLDGWTAGGYGAVKLLNFGWPGWTGCSFVLWCCDLPAPTALMEPEKAKRLLSVHQR